MKDVLTKLKDGTGIVWKDKDGNSTSAPADWGVAYTDADGKEYMAADGTTPLTLDEIAAAGKPVYLQLKNVQNLEGAALQGQVATSDNWTIQRSANARYTVDNWPMEMESASNSVSDVIEAWSSASRTRAMRTLPSARTLLRWSSPSRIFWTRSTRCC